MILPGATLGLLGGGQLGRMFTLAAQSMGYRVLVLDPDPECPAAQVADGHLHASYDDRQALARLAAECAAVTTEFENIPTGSLDFLAASIPVRPASASVAIAQDRVREKTFLRNNGFDTAQFAVITGTDEIAPALQQIGLPAILKTTRLGYDGKGQARIENLDSAREAFIQMGGATCVLEEMVGLEHEISVVLGRGIDGEVSCYPVTENQHHDGVLAYSLAPSRLGQDIQRRARAVAMQIAERLDYCGVLAVEFFVCADGRLLVNEIAPRPHNSGHWTLSGAETSQFEQQVRALCGLPLGETRSTGPVAMINLLGNLWQGEQAPAWDNLLRHPDAKLYLYGKKEARAGRKMGHCTCHGTTSETALNKAFQIMSELGIRAQ